MLLEIITGKRTVDEEGTNLVETSHGFLEAEARHRELLDPRIKETVTNDVADGEKQLEAVVTVVRLQRKKAGLGHRSNKY
ncbi:unnamed protein product [Cochlearia groenlandica]